MSRLGLLLLSLATGALLAACDVNPQPLPPGGNGANVAQPDGSPTDNTGGGRDGAPPAPADAGSDASMGNDGATIVPPDAANDAPADGLSDAGDASEGGEGWDATLE